MQIISHRVNTINKLKSTPLHYGVEIDVRSNTEDLIIQHDPLTKGILFKSWLDNYNHKFLVVNIKEEGLEELIFKYLIQYKINDFFLLDQSFPFLVKTAFKGESRIAARFSEYESIDTALSLAGKVDWIWIDYFIKFPLTPILYKKLIDFDFKLCAVSPELQGHSFTKIREMQYYLKLNKIVLDSICTKYPAEWIDFN